MRSTREYGVKYNRKTVLISLVQKRHVFFGRGANAEWPTQNFSSRVTANLPLCLGPTPADALVRLGFWLSCGAWRLLLLFFLPLGLR